MNPPRLSCVTAVLLGLAAGGFGQVRVQQGNVLHANPRVGSGGLNYGTRQYQTNWGNRIVTGNAAGGLSFRGYSPIQDPSSLFVRNYSSATGTSSGVGSNLGLSGLANVRAGLPSDALTNFNRDSVSVANVRQGRVLNNLTRSPYYSPSSTVANTGAIVAGLNQPGSSQLISPYIAPRPVPLSIPTDPLATGRRNAGSLLNVAPQMVRIDTGQTLTGQANERLLGSPLFGAVRQVSMDQVASQAQRDRGGALTPLRPDPISAIEPDRAGAGRSNQGSAGELDPRVGSIEDPAHPANRGQLRSTGEGPLTGGGELRRPMPGGLAGPLQPGAGLGAAGQPGGVAFRGAGRSQTAPPVLEGTVRSFAGSLASAANQRLADAEDLLKRGQFYRAAEAFEAARVIDPAHPLPLLGQSMALLGAGDYISSANSLIIGIRRHDALPRLQLDLRTLIPTASVLQERRADLESRLQIAEDFRLRFLLGYVEYSSQREESGLANMEKATADLPDSFEPLKRFVTALREQAAVPSTRPAEGP